MNFTNLVREIHGFTFGTLKEMQSWPNRWIPAPPMGTHPGWEWEFWVSLRLMRLATRSKGQLRESKFGKLPKHPRNRNTWLMPNSCCDIVDAAIKKLKMMCGLAHGQPWNEQIARKQAFVKTAQSATAIYSTFLGRIVR
jgi:hypothetical protein